MNNAAIGSIAYDRVRHFDKPEVWEMPRVPGLASALGLTGIIASSGRFYLGERVFHLSGEVMLL